MTLPERLQKEIEKEIEKKNFSKSAIKGFAKDPMLALVIGAAIGYSFAISDRGGVPDKKEVETNEAG